MAFVKPMELLFAKRVDITARLRPFVIAAALVFAFASPLAAQCPAVVPSQGSALPGPLPLFPADNWWNADISAAPVDPRSASFIAFINNGGTRRLHPDFGGEESPGSTSIYGMPYAVVGANQPKLAVTFHYWDESDGVNYATGQGVPFYPIPAQAITQPHWIEGGAPGNVDQRSRSDRHLLMIDCANKHLYELYNVWFDPGAQRWLAGSGAFFDLNVNGRRPETWTSADAAGLAIFPGLVRYDEAWDPAVTEIGHAFRVTVRATNGHVFPASHTAGTTNGALPMGARLRLKSLVNGVDPALRTSNANVRKIFRAMQKHGLIVADNGSDLYITGTFDKRWNNGVLNPAFAQLTASDFEVIELGWKPPVVPTCSGFEDIAASDPFCANVAWMRNRAVTVGCTTTTYCPAAAVQRLMMAAFLARLGGVISVTPLLQQASSGPLDLGDLAILCVTPDHATPAHPQRAELDAVFSATATETIGIDVGIFASVDGGASWEAIGEAAIQTVPGGQWANVRTMASRDLEAGETIRFALGVARRSGAANLDDGRCVLRGRLWDRDGAQMDATITGKWTVAHEPVADGASHSGALVPVTMSGLPSGMPASLHEVLSLLIERGYAEAEVIRALFEVAVDLSTEGRLSTKASRQLARALRNAPALAEETRVALRARLPQLQLKTFQDRVATSE